MKTREAAIAASSPSPSLVSYGHLLVIYLVWGAAYLAVKICLSGPATVTVLQLQTARLWAAAILLAAISAVAFGPPPRLSRRDLGSCALSGILMWVGGNGLAAMASQHAASSFVVMALGAIPLWSTLLDVATGRSKPRPDVLVGLAVGLGGLGLVMAPALLAPDAVIVEPEHALMTVVLLAGAGLAWASGTMLQHPLMGRSPPAWTATYQIGAAALALTLPMLIEGAPLPHAPSNGQLGAFAFLILFASVIALISFIQVVRSFGPAVASTFAYVNPMVGILLGWLILGEVPALLSLAGMAVVLISIALILKEKPGPGTANGSTRS
jgi:drug/metabolite transporter (DMT)-like permease